MDPVSAQPPIGLGIVGLGRVWASRHKPAIARRADKFRVAAVFDQVASLAAAEAASLRCEAAAGPRNLIDRPDVDAILVLTPQWFGPHAVELAIRAGKAVLCAQPLFDDRRTCEQLAALAGQAKARLRIESPRRLYPATLRLQELLATELGQPSLIQGLIPVSGSARFLDPGPSTQTATGPRWVDPGGYWIDWCSQLIGKRPTSLRRLEGQRSGASGTNRPHWDSLALDFESGESAVVEIVTVPRKLAHPPWPPAGFRVHAERGTAWLELPDRITWSVGDSAPQRENLASATTLGDSLCEQLAPLIAGNPVNAMTIDDCAEIARLLETAVVA